MSIEKSKTPKVAAPIEVKSLPIDRDNLTFITAGLWQYKHKGSLEECKVPGVFRGPAANDFNIRISDVVICSNETEAVLVVVQK